MEALIDAFLTACPQPLQQQPPPEQHVSTTTTIPNITPPVTLRKAAVLLPLFEHPEDGQIHCLLTVRPSHMRSHAGEVCFPGGKVEEGETVVQTAMREAWEEIGLAPEAVRVVGEMTPTLSLHLLEVTPVLAVIPADFAPRIQPEVRSFCVSGVPCVGVATTVPAPQSMQGLREGMREEGRCVLSNA